MGETDLLRELHDEYAWRVNAAFAEGRMGLVWEFEDEYTNEAVQLMTAGRSRGCGRAECAICAGGTSNPTVPDRRRRFWRRHPSAG